MCSNPTGCGIWCYKMKLETLDIICCPVCKGTIQLDIQEAAEDNVIKGTLSCGQCNRHFEIRDGLPNLIFPETLKPSNFKEQKIYDQRARWYDLRNRLSNIKHGDWGYIFFEERRKKSLTNLLELKENTSVLETGAGTGRFLQTIYREIGEGGKLHGSDISHEMIKIAAKKIEANKFKAELLLANASYLPYRSALFDAVFHTGGINTFADKKLAIEEMCRVAKQSAKIVISDEGLAPGKEKTRSGQKIIKRDAFYATKPPVDLIPDNICDLKVSWSDSGLYWKIAFSKS